MSNEFKIGDIVSVKGYGSGYRISGTDGWGLNCGTLYNVEGIDDYSFSAKELTRESKDDLNKASVANWLPIDQAPKDGTKILVYGTNIEIGTGDSTGKEEIGVAGWSEIYEGDEEKCWLDEAGFYAIEWFPTHFMPLPAPPTDTPITQGD